MGDFPLPWLIAGGSEGNFLFALHGGNMIPGCPAGTSLVRLATVT